MRESSPYPVHVAEPVDTVTAALHTLGTSYPVQGYVRRIMNVSSDPPQWVPWYAWAVRTMLRLGAEPHLDDMITRIEQSQNPLQRERKGLAEFTSPERWLVKEIIAWCRRKNIRWTQLPK